MKIINGKVLSLKLEDEIREKVKSFDEKVTLAVVLIGDNEASKVYVKNKIKACERVGINSLLVKMEENSKFEDVKTKILSLVNNEEVDAILLQLPLPKHLDEQKLMNLIPKEKDADGFCDEVIIDLFKNKKTIYSCTPEGIVYMLKSQKIKLEGSHCVIIGRSLIVGKPLALALLNENATVTVCNSKTNNLKEITKTADILISAVGKPNFVTEDMVNDHMTVIDVGINRVNGKICGDVDFDNVSKKVKLITPVPGGVGPLTITFLLKNTLQLKENKINDRI